ncbi:MAG TPA: hypothetical protein VIK53_02655 [Verrucomicrobiae bacterium]
MSFSTGIVYEDPATMNLTCDELLFAPALAAGTQIHVHNCLSSERY